MANKTITKSNVSTLTADQVEQKLATFKHTSTKVRYLHSLGMTTSDISKTLKIRYQHVRNVLITPVTKQSEQI